MNDQKDENRLDELIKLSINTAKPEFDVEQWKSRYPEEHRMLFKQQSVYKLDRSLRVGLAAVAMIAVIFGLFLITHERDHHKDPHKNPTVAQSPTEMLTDISLRMAYRRGGMDAVEKQCDEAFGRFRLPPKSLSVEQLLAEFNGNDRESERTRL
ncbi:MAG: hypothetical protein ACYSWP_19965 [Planctomycetota bacterium]|jgi:hypothetical protein